MSAGKTKPPALERFRGYLLRSVDLEMRKERLARCPKGMRQAHRYIMEIDERAIERGWEEVVTVERNYSERAAKLLADHYLFGMCWQDAATESKLAIDKAKKEAYAALIWLDTHDRSNQTK